MKLRDAISELRKPLVQGTLEREILSVTADSRTVEEGSVFVAVRGKQADGRRFIDDAVQRGAVAVIADSPPETGAAKEITWLQVADPRAALSSLAAKLAGSPSADLKLAGVTGTNGKTTIAFLLHHLMRSAWHRAGMIGTIRIDDGIETAAASHTTPDVITINDYLAKMNVEGVEFCFMEVSSHGIHQKRSEGLHFAGAVFTNLSHDHLDYHKTFADYRDTKKKLFDGLPKTAFALVNIDDKNGLVMLQNTKARKHTYALKSYADYRAQILERQFNGQLLKLDENELWSKLIGDFNAYNLLAIYAVADLLGLEKMETLRLMSELETVDGRFQYYISKEKITAIVDYAHTPDALKNVLMTINALRTGNEKVITVVGCGGDRDKSKRPVMGHIASEMSNQAIFTSDNPRSEPPSAIIEEMEKGVEPQNVKKVLSIENRRQAIMAACQLAMAKDIILVAGKGHETYQETNGVRVDFDDLKEVKEALESLNK